jgi:predicted AAA+ superfamily ATPase
MVNRISKLPKKGSFFLFGARGTGKTTLLKGLYPEALYINLLRSEEEEELTKSPSSLRSRVATLKGHQRVIIDEIQKIPKLLDEVHQLIEDGHDSFILTGSSARKLKRGAGNLLGGRAAFRALFPLTHVELAEKFDLNLALEFGTLPKLLQLDDREAKIDYLQSYVRSYIREEIQIEQVVRRLDPFRGFLEVAAQMNGKILNYSKIEREVGASVKTIQNYYQILVDTHLGFVVNGFHESWRKQLSQAPKFYFFDPGLTRALARRTQLGLSPSSYEYGDLFEQFIICECFRMNEYSNREFRFSYLRSKDGAEIDLIIDRPGMKRALVEIKSSQQIQREDLTHIIQFKKEHPSAEAYCLSRDPNAKKIEKVICLPWQAGLKELGLG